MFSGEDCTYLLGKYEMLQSINLLCLPVLDFLE